MTTDRNPIDVPIIMSGSMVRATLRDIDPKTMTRRIAYQTRRNFSPAKNPLIDGPWTKIRPGDRLWVREAWSAAYEWTGVPPREIGYGPAWYWADGNPEDGDWTKPFPSIHMPRKFSRLTLIVEAVKRELLQAISHADVLAEGIPADAPIGAFPDLWRSLHGPKSWDENPEVVAIGFRPIKANIDAEEVRAAA